MHSSQDTENGMSANGQAEAQGTLPPPANDAPSLALAKDEAVPLKSGWIEQLRRAIGLRPNAAFNNASSFKSRIKNLADALLSERGEVLGTVIAHDLAQAIRRANPQELAAFAALIASHYAPDEARLNAAIDAWRANPTGNNLTALTRAAEAPRQELFRRINMAPGGTATLVGFRQFLLTRLREHPELMPVDADLSHLFTSWFNRGFLEMRRIDWRSPAVVLEKLITYEAVHAIAGWDDLRRRLAADRRCFAFFHPALPDDPLIFIEVALVNKLSDKIEPIIQAPMPSDADSTALATPTHAIFYSISNCQAGLRGVSFGNFLIKQVAADLAHELPSLKIFSTLSPIPGFRAWLDASQEALPDYLPRDLVQQMLATTGASTLNAAIQDCAALPARTAPLERLYRDTLMRLAARYVTGAGLESGPRDPVARFHLGNGARVERINWNADLSPKGMRESYGLMVNYLYDLGAIETNHEAFANKRPVAIAKPIAELLDNGATGLGRSLFRKG